MNDDLIALASISGISMFIGLVLTVAGHPSSGATVAFMGLVPLGFVGLIGLGIKADEFFGVENAWAYETVGSNNRSRHKCNPNDNHEK